MASCVNDLVSAIYARERALREAYYELRDRFSEDGYQADADSAVSKALRDVRESFNLVSALRRAVAGMDRGEVLRVFGAPGDYGYETDVGQALDRFYRAP